MYLVTGARCYLMGCKNHYVSLTVYQVGSYLFVGFVVWVGRLTNHKESEGLAIGVEFWWWGMWIWLFLRGKYVMWNFKKYAHICIYIYTYLYQVKMNI